MGYSLAKEHHDHEADEEIIGSMGDHAWDKTAGPFIDPGPEKAAPKDTDKPDRTVSMRERKEACAD